MARRPPADLDLVNQFYERWAPYEDRRRDISDDLKELFAEAKSNGLNPKALRAAFAEKYRIDNQTSDEAEKRLRNDDDFELYMQALARVRESDDESDPVSTTTNASVPAGFDPETGEEITTQIDRLKIEPLTHTAPSPQVVQADHESTEAGTARRDNSTEGKPAPVALNPEAAITPPASESPPVDTHSIAKIDAGGENVDAAADNAGGGDSLPAVASNVAPFVPKPHDDPLSSKGLRRHKMCRDLELCAGNWRDGCHGCRTAQAVAVPIIGSIGQ